MTHRTLAALIVLNVVLLAGLSVTVFNPTPAQAQFGQGQQFTMISGAVTGRSNQDMIYILDLSSSKVLPVIYNGSSKKFEPFKGRVIAEDMRSNRTGR